jgi:ATP-dependent Clp protease ATP-binding subunit ClpC
MSAALDEPLGRCTTRVWQALVLADAAAKRAGGSAVAPAHLLMGLAGEGEGVAARALRQLGADEDRLRRALAGEPLGPPASGGVGGWLHRIFSRRPRPILAPERLRQAVGQLALTGETRRALEGARAEARRRDEDLIATEHVLLALLEEPAADVRDLLARLALSPAQIRGAVWEIIQLAARQPPRI